MGMPGVSLLRAQEQPHRTPLSGQHNPSAYDPPVPNLALQRKRVEKALVALRSPDLRRALRQKVLPATEHLPVLAGLPGDVALVVDIGANVGQFSLVARHRWPQARIVSFEPLPACAAQVRALFVGDGRFECLSFALTDSAGPAAFHVTGAEDSSSLLPIARRQVEEFETAEARVVQVETARLDDALPPDALPEAGRPIVVKLDTQGTELAVLRGGPTLLARATHLLVEVSFVELYEGQADAAELTRFLVEQGWDLRSVYDVKASRRTGEPLQADALFVRRT
jgi:FkbM family methyltransferase